MRSRAGLPTWMLDIEFDIQQETEETCGTGSRRSTPRLSSSRCAPGSGLVATLESDSRPSGYGSGPQKYLKYYEILIQIFQAVRIRPERTSYPRILVSNRLYRSVEYRATWPESRSKFAISKKATT